MKDYSAILSEDRLIIIYEKRIFIIMFFLDTFRLQSHP